VRRNRGDIGHQILRADRSPVPLTEISEQVRRDVGNAGITIVPEREDTPTTPIMMVEVSDQPVKVSAGPADGDLSLGAVKYTCRFEYDSHNVGLGPLISRLSGMIH
jgi:hypothetical protein